jgi:hypothetical protein
MAQFVVTSHQLKKWGSALEAASINLPDIEEGSHMRLQTTKIAVALALRDLENTLRTNNETIPHGE